MSRFLLPSFLLLGIGFLHSPALACSLCEALAQRQTLRLEMQQAKLVLYGIARNPKLNAAMDARPGSGTSDFEIKHIIKPHPALGNQTNVVLDRYIPVLNPKEPPRFIIFFDIFKDKLDPFRGIPVQSEEMLKYLGGTTKLAKGSGPEALQYYFQFLEHPDPEISGDAFLEFAKANDHQLREVAGKLPVAKLRVYLTDPKTPTERLGLFAFLLGAAGHQEDRELFQRMLDLPTQRNRRALDGLLTGYIQLNPDDGWKRVLTLLADRNSSFSERFAATRVLRMYHNLNPKESEPWIAKGLEIMLKERDMADLAIEHLRKWEIWKLTPQVLAIYNRPNFEAPVTRRAILRYALTCPDVRAASFLRQLRLLDHERELIQEVQDVLELERKLSSR